MDISEVFTRINMLTGALGFIITIMVLICIHLKQPISMGMGFIIGLAIYVGLLLFAYTSRTIKLHSKILAPVRRWVQFLLSSIVIEEWNATISLDEDGTAHTIHDFKGKINFGHNKWITIGILADSPQPETGSFWIRVTNVDTGKDVKPQVFIDCQKFKRFKIFFDRTLKRDDKFHYKVEYKLLQSYFFGQKDHYSQDATHFEKKINIRINFPQTVYVSSVDSEILTAHGDNWGAHKRPKFGDNWIEWAVEKAVMSNKHRLIWTTIIK